MKYGKFLQEGGTIGFIAPSFGCNIEPYKSAFNHAKEKFQQLGYQLNLGSNCYEGCGVGISNTPQKCAEEFMEYYQKEDNDCLISCGGGELMCEILPYIDWEIIKQASPKWFLGYSDNTNITYLLATICDTASIYGPCASTFGMKPWHSSLRDVWNLLTGKSNQVKGYDFWEKESLREEENPCVPYYTTEPRILHCFQGIEKQKEKPIPKEITGSSFQIEGRLLGGCMDCLVTLLGTRFDKTHQFLEKYKEDGILWFLEACDLNVFSIRRAMWQMEQAGWFQYVKGFLIGRPRCGEEIMGLDKYQAVLEVAAYKNVPVIMDLDIGHLPPMMPLIVGSLAQVKVESNDITIEMRLEKSSKANLEYPI